MWDIDVLPSDVFINAISNTENTGTDNDHTRIILERAIPVQLTSVSCWLCFVHDGTWDADANNAYDGLWSLPPGLMTVVCTLLYTHCATYISRTFCPCRLPVAIPASAHPCIIPKPAFCTCSQSHHTDITESILTKYTKDRWDFKLCCHFARHCINLLLSSTVK